MFANYLRLRLAAGVLALLAASGAQASAAPGEHLLAAGVAGLSPSAKTYPNQAAAHSLGLGAASAMTKHSVMLKLLPEPRSLIREQALFDLPIQENLAPAEVMPIESTDCTRIKCVAITIDDGPGPQTETLLTLLAAAEARATFFVVGAEVVRNPELTAAIVAGGHELGLHSHTHPRMTTLSDVAVLREFELSRQAIYDSVGQEIAIYRPPYGLHSKRIGQLANAAIIMWDVDPQDWRRVNQRKITGHTVARVQPGSIVLLHELAATTRALPGILEKLRADGYQFVTVSELLGSDLPPGQVFTSGPAPEPTQ